jgi:hypothetical protein
MDFRKADPSYVGFVPTTAAEAIDLFCRYRKLGVSPNQWPETFVHVCRELPAAEIDRFQEWLICPQGPATGQTFVPCPEVEAERKQLLKEAEARDRLLTTLARRASGTDASRMDIDEEEKDDEKMETLSASVADCTLEHGADTGK